MADEIERLKELTHQTHDVAAAVEIALREMTDAQKSTIADVRRELADIRRMLQGHDGANGLMTRVRLLESDRGRVSWLGIAALVGAVGGIISIIMTFRLLG